MRKLAGDSWGAVITLFLFKVQNCSEFFNYYNLTDGEAMELANKRAKGFLIEAVSRLTSQCTPDVDFHDYDTVSEKFGFELTKDEADLLARLMFEMFLEKDIAKLRVFTNTLSSQDLKYAFSGYGERNSFVGMFEKVQNDNKNLIDGYISKDRLTGARKSVNYDI